MIVAFDVPLTLMTKQGRMCDRGFPAGMLSVHGVLLACPAFVSGIRLRYSSAAGGKDYVSPVLLLMLSPPGPHVRLVYRLVTWTNLGLVDRGCAMAWGDPCTCGDDCMCVNCPQHMKKVRLECMRSWVRGSECGKCA